MTPKKNMPETENLPILEEAPAKTPSVSAQPPVTETTAVKAVPAKKPAVRKTAAKKAETVIAAAAEEPIAEEKPAEAAPVKKTAAKKPAAKKPAASRAKTAATKKTPAKKAPKSTEPLTESVPKEEVAEIPAVPPETILAQPEAPLPASAKKVLLVGSECVPFAKTGGLADVLGTLPKELRQLGIDARVILPFHSSIKAKYRMETEHVADFFVRMGYRTKFVGIEKLVLDGVIYYFVDNEDYFGGAIYKGQDPETEQYAFFCRAVIEGMYRMDFIPDILHLNDWQTGMIPLLIKTQYKNSPLSGIKMLFTIHNMMYQGKCGFPFIQDLLSVEKRYYTPEFMEANGCANLMKAGLVFCDRISTVSPTYAQELRNPAYAYGLEGILNARAHETVGIVNGIDTDDYDPAADPNIAKHYSAADFSGKEENKRAVMEKMGLAYQEGVPLIGVVSRLTTQKGFDLVSRVFHEIMEQPVSFLLLGSGDREYESFFRAMENQYKGRVCSYIGYDNTLAHQIYAGCDLFLMPSKFEPCGISQLISQRYGTLPIVRETGGLKDTVIPFNEYTGEGTGFSFTNYNAHEMLGAIRYACSCVTDQGKRNKLIENVMHLDNSFAVSARRYRDLYLSMI